MREERRGRDGRHLGARAGETVEATAANVDSTPSFLVNGKPATMENVEAAIAAAL